eukprot:2869597-Prymnesium_polylepis.1
MGGENGSKPTSRRMSSRMAALVRLESLPVWVLTANSHERTAALIAETGESGVRVPTRARASRWLSGVVGAAGGGGGGAVGGGGGGGGGDG